MRRLLPLAPALLFLAGFFVLPMLDIVGRSITAADGSLTLARYALLFGDAFYLRAMAETLALSAGVTLLCVLAGYPVAYYLVRHAGRWRGVILFTLVAPLLTSIIMRTFGWQVLFARRGPVNLLLEGLGLVEAPIRFTGSLGIAIAALVHVLLPFMVLSITPVLQSIDRRLEEAAAILGAGRFRAFLEVTLPLSWEGILTGCILVFMVANGSFVTLLLLGGGLQTLPLLIYQQFNTTRDFGMVSAMSTVLLLLALACLALQLRLVRKGG
ncbi:ABC transporter permease [Roseomonas sp. GC11]|uniref:ABC transporter permease n=1 Tax=Roseomonas sp. GC11 TaxID=2950546 RepID=UPI0021090665|nr:ABC transporter permease [Roseomonas sp. GC11]MCQ4160322.1 ABC transporter permease [Roseomonas sp. GC11]